MAFLYAGALGAWFLSGGAVWTLFFLIGISVAQVLTVGIPSGALRVAGLCVDDADRRTVFSSALAVWACVVCYTGVLFAAYWLLHRYWGIVRFDPRIGLALLAGVFTVLAAVGGSACLLRGRKAVVTAMWALFGACLSLAVFFPGVQLLIAGGAAALCVLILWLCAWMRPGRIEKKTVYQVIRRGRLEWIVWLLYALPGAMLCVFLRGLTPGYLIGMIFVTAIGADRLDAEASQRRLAWMAVCAMPVFAAIPWCAGVLGFAPYAGLMLAWALGVSMLPSLSGRAVRYGGVTVLLFTCSAAGCLDWPYGGVAALIPLALVAMLLRRFIYLAYLPIRARALRRH